MPDLTQQIRGLSVLHELYAHSRSPQVFVTLRECYGDIGIDEAKRISGLTISQGAIVHRQPQTTRVFVTGVDGPRQPRTVAIGYANVSRIGTRGGWHPDAYDDARNIWENDVRPVMRPEDTLELHGHSAGGMITEIIAKFVQTAYPDAQIKIDTYGCPMAGHAGVYAGGLQLTRNRWMLRGDPVPWIPSAEVTTGTYILLWIFTPNYFDSADHTMRPELFVHPAGGKMITPEAIRPRDVPELGPRPAVIIQRWMDGNEEQLDIHASDTYRIMMRLHMANHPETTQTTTATPARPRGHVPEMNVVLEFPIPGTRPTNIVMPIEIRPNGITLDSAGRSIGVTTIKEVPMSFLKINPKHGFRRVKVGNVWKVTLDGQIILTADEKTVPGAIVKRGNSFLRALGTRNTVFMTDLADAFSQWMIAATSNDDFARPLLRGVP